MNYVATALLGVSAFVFCMAFAETLLTWWFDKIKTYATWMTIEFEAMFQEMTVETSQRLISAMVFGMALLGALFGSSILTRILAAAVFGFAGYFGPWGLVTYLHRRRMDTIDYQFVDALLMMANGLKAGLSLQQSIELVAREMKPPISDEFGRLVKEIHLGRLTDDALRRFRERVPLEDVSLAVESILTLRETGGNLSETFQVIAHTIVERKKVQGKIKSLTAQGMSQGILICCMPPAMMLLFSLIDANYMAPFFNTFIGWMMMLTVFLLDGLGLWAMFKLVQVDV